MTIRPSETLNVELSGETSTPLAELARQMDREASAVAAKAITEFVEREREIVAGIHRGLEDIAAGRITPHDEVMRRLYAIIDRAEQRE